MAVLVPMSSTLEHRLEPTTDLSALPSPQAKLVYLSLLGTEEATATELQGVLGLSKLSLLPTLQVLVAAELVVRTDDGYAVRYGL